MGIDVTVLRVFTDPDGNHGNTVAIVDSGTVAPGDRQRVATQLGFSETLFIDMPESGANTAHARIYTPVTELPFAGHPAMGASWWLREQGTPIRTLQVPAGIVPVGYGDGVISISARSEWAPEFAIYDLASTEELFAADPDDYPDDVNHYLWTWTDKEQGALRSRMFATDLGLPEDEATGGAAVRITDYLSRDLTIVQGKGSMIYTEWSHEGWVRLAGRVVNDGTRQID